MTIFTKTVFYALKQINLDNTPKQENTACFRSYITTMGEIFHFPSLPAT